MDSRKTVYHETGIIAIGEFIGVAVMLLLFWVLGKADGKVFLGCALGYLLAVGNFFFMAVGTSLAADKAEAGDVKAGQRIVATSMRMRYLVLIVVLFVLGKSKLCNPIALAVPLLFPRMTISLSEFFRTKGDTKS